MNTALVPLLQAKIVTPEFFLTPAAIAERDTLIADLAVTITDVQTAQELVDAGVAGARFIKRVSADRLSLTRPLDGWKKDVMTLEESLLGPLQKAIEDATRKVTAWRLAEAQRVLAEAEERRKREREAIAAAAAAAAKAAAEQQRAERLDSAASAARAAKAAGQAEAAELAMREVISAPVPVAEVPKGSSLRKIVRWEITDAPALFKQCPHFFEIVPRRAVINASVTGTTSLPGLKVWEEYESGFRQSSSK